VNPAPDFAGLDHYLAVLREAIDAALGRALVALDAPPLIVNAMRYSLLAGGKRLRPCLTLATAEAVLPADTAGARARALPAAVAVEMVHTYSLIHDDLPAMDDDALRRGRPTSHMVHGDGLAILAGDGLLTDAFRVLASSDVASRVTGDGNPAPADARLRAIAVLARAAGAAGMVGGQAIDLAAAGKVPGQHARLDTASALEDMHSRKTGALIRAAAVTGAVLAGGHDRAIEAVDDYARELGLAFQIIDDILDVESSDAALGKTAGKDAAAGKPTYPALYGLDESRRLAAACVDRAHTSLSRAGLGGRLHELAVWSLARQS
jgi:geranylgeranyl pyrophosphate synthase